MENSFRFLDAAREVLIRFVAVLVTQRVHCFCQRIDLLSKIDIFFYVFFRRNVRCALFRVFVCFASLVSDGFFCGAAGTCFEIQSLCELQILGLQRC